MLISQRKMNMAYVFEQMFGKMAIAGGKGGSKSK